MKFESDGVIAVPFDTLRPILERFADVQVEGRAVILTFPDGEISDQMLDVNYSCASTTIILVHVTAPQQPGSRPLPPGGEGPARMIPSRHNPPFLLQPQSLNRSEPALLAHF
jgi:hypothetical protein